MKNNFIKCSDAETIARLKEAGFSVVSEQNGVVTFLNNRPLPLNFTAEKKLVFSDKLEL